MSILDQIKMEMKLNPSYLSPINLALLLAWIEENHGFMPAQGAMIKYVVPRFDTRSGMIYAITLKSVGTDFEVHTQNHQRLVTKSLDERVKELCEFIASNRNMACRAWEPCWCSKCNKFLTGDEYHFYKNNDGVYCQECWPGK